MITNSIDNGLLSYLTITSVILFTNYLRSYNNYIFYLLYSYETSDGVSRSEQAELKTIDNDSPPFLAVRGTITWTAADGQQYTLNYIADENGFQPEGDHLPKL